MLEQSLEPWNFIDFKYERWLMVIQSLMIKPSIAAILLALVLVATAALPTFDDYSAHHKLKFSSQNERVYRQKTYKLNCDRITKNNNDSKSAHVEAVNHLSFLTRSEFVALHLKTRVPAGQEVTIVKVPVGSSWNPTVKDWSVTEAVTSIKDQGRCGAGWAFAVAAALESLAFKSNSVTDADYSEQQLISCSQSTGNNGCDGGWMNSAFEFVKGHGIATEAVFPYGPNGVDTTTSCSNGGSFKISKYTKVSPDCVSAATALSTRPLSVAVDAAGWANYKSGIFKKCATVINHGVLLVGVNSTAWKIKNSWGTAWGDKGFIYLDATQGANTCGVCSYASYPVK